MAADAEVGSLSGDGDIRSQMANVTESTGAAAAWAGEIAKLGAVMGTGIGVAIVDSGIANHSALAGRVVANAAFTSTGSKNKDDYGHGTHVAGIVAAGAPKHDTGEEPVGMAPGAHLVSVKILDENGTGKVSDAIRGIDWVIANKAEVPDSCHEPVDRHRADAGLQGRSAVPGRRARRPLRHRRRRFVWQLRPGHRGQAGARHGHVTGDFAVRDHGRRAADAGHRRSVGRCGRAVELEGADGGGSPGEAGRRRAGQQGGVAARIRVDAGEAVPRSHRGGRQGRLLPVERHESGDGRGEWRGSVVVGVAAAAEPAAGQAIARGER